LQTHFSGESYAFPSKLSVVRNIAAIRKFDANLSTLAPNKR
jgi:hypothetical protein